MAFYTGSGQEVSDGDSRSQFEMNFHCVATNGSAAADTV
jgi:hypothetical protein